MKRILLTGSNGLLGQKLTELILRDTDLKLIATAKGENRYPGNDAYIYAEMDIRDQQNVQQILEKYRPDAVINTAAMTNVDFCENNKDDCRELNVEAVKNLIYSCEKLNIHLLHLSTDFIFDGEAGPYTEEAEPNPLSYYGATKLEAENLIQSSSCNWTIIRTIIVYGIVYNMSRSNIVLWAKNALEKGEVINVVEDQWRMPTLAEDLAECCLLAIKKEAQGIFNVCGKNMMSILELVEKVAEHWNLDKSLIIPVKSKSLKQDAQRPKKTGFILEKAMQNLGYNPHSFSEGLTILDEQLKLHKTNLKL